MKKKLTNLRNGIMFIAFLGLVSLVFIYTFFIKKQDTVSLFENRNLSVKNDLLNTHFTDSTFQNTLEDVLADQFYERQTIVIHKKKFDSDVTNFLYGESIDDAILSKIGDTNVYQVGNSKYMINGLMEYSEDYKNRILNRINQMNELANDYPDISFYLYRPIQGHETSLFDEANEISSYGDYYNQLFKDNINFPVAFLELKSIDDYKEKFYSSDHHWNYRGAYQGYVDIMKLMGKEDEILEPTAINSCNNYKFYGTFSSRTAYLLEPDDYILYEIDYSDVKLVLDGEEQEIDTFSPKYYLAHLDEYNDEFLYHYNYSYSGYSDYPYYQYKNDLGEGNILVIGDSYATAISHLLASSFENSYFVNQTTYLNNTGKFFNYDDFIEEHDIDTVLFMYTIENYFITDKEYGDVYKNFDVYRSVKE